MLPDRFAEIFGKSRIPRVDRKHEWTGPEEVKLARIKDLVLTSGGYDQWKNRFGSPSLTERFEECLQESAKVVGLSFEFQIPFEPGEYNSNAPLLREVGVLDFENGPQINVGVNFQYELVAVVAFKDNQTLLENKDNLRVLLDKCQGIRTFGLEGKAALEQIEEEFKKRTLASKEYQDQKRRYSLKFEIENSKGNQYFIGFLIQAKQLWQVDLPESGLL